MKFLLFLTTAISLCTISLANELSFKLEKNEIDFIVIQKEVEWFIDKVKENSYKHGQHNVYAVDIYEGKVEGEFCITIGYFDNYFLFSHLKEFEYYLYLKEDLIILDFSMDFKEKFLLENADSVKLLLNKQIIIDKIDMEMAAIGTWPAYICCFTNDKIVKVFYENSDEIPSEIDVFDMNHSESGIIIDIDSTTFKEILKGKQKDSISCKGEKIGPIKRGR